MTKELSNYESFFGAGTEEEQLRIKEIASSIGVRDNDAIWIIVYVMNYFGRFYQDLPAQMKKSAEVSIENVKARCVAMAEEEVNRAKINLTQAVLIHADEIAKRKEMISVIQPLAWLSCGIFSLCLLCFVAGAAVAGKGWGSSPLDALLLAPAGWILPVIFLPASLYSGWRAWSQYRLTKRINNLLALSCSAIMTALVILCFMRAF